MECFTQNTDKNVVWTVTVLWVVVQAVQTVILLGPYWNITSAEMSKCKRRLFSWLPKQNEGDTSHTRRTLPQLCFSCFLSWLSVLSGRTKIKKEVQEPHSKSFQWIHEPRNWKSLILFIAVVWMNKFRTIHDRRVKWQDQSQAKLQFSEWIFYFFSSDQKYRQSCDLLKTVAKFPHISGNVYYGAAHTIERKDEHITPQNYVDVVLTGK